MAQAVLERVGATPLDALSMQAGARGATLGAAGRGDAPVVVIGGGPAGMRVADGLSRRGLDVVVLNAEKWDPYNRVKLTPLLAGDVQLGDVTTAPSSEGDGEVAVLTGSALSGWMLIGRRVQTADGGVHPYSALVLATGSQAFMPKIPGRDRQASSLFATPPMWRR